mmetsp:Transcript_102889/g.300200  ORF Transcript_102889/g.300200 Transcript_102889/m.300200 type:complete len:237 (-) Transcript_102889:557-1267(-)
METNWKSVSRMLGRLEKRLRIMCPTSSSSRYTFVMNSAPKQAKMKMKMNMSKKAESIVLRQLQRPCASFQRPRKDATRRTARARRRSRIMRSTMTCWRNITTSSPPPYSSRGFTTCVITVIKTSAKSNKFAQILRHTIPFTNNRRLSSSTKMPRKTVSMISWEVVSSPLSSLSIVHPMLAAFSAMMMPIMGSKPPHRSTRPAQALIHGRIPSRKGGSVTLLSVSWSRSVPLVPWFW